MSIKNTCTHTHGGCFLKQARHNVIARTLSRYCGSWLAFDLLAVHPGITGVARSQERGERRVEASRRDARISRRGTRQARRAALRKAKGRNGHRRSAKLSAERLASRSVSSISFDHGQLIELIAARDFHPRVEENARTAGLGSNVVVLSRVIAMIERAQNYIVIVSSLGTRKCARRHVARADRIARRNFQIFSFRFNDVPAAIRRQQPDILRQEDLRCRARRSARARHR